jgi:hypothetical protein
MQFTKILLCTHSILFGISCVSLAGCSAAQLARSDSAAGAPAEVIIVQRYDAVPVDVIFIDQGAPYSAPSSGVDHVPDVGG